MPVPDRSLSVLDGSTFVLGDDRGDVVPAPARPHGFFYDDTRFVHRWQLTLDGRVLEPLSVARSDYFALQFFLVPPAHTVYENPSVTVIRRRLVRGTWLEEVAVINHAHTDVVLPVEMAVDTDFADLFEVKDDEVRRRDIERVAGEDELMLRYRRGDFLRETRIGITAAGCQVTEHGFHCDLQLGPREVKRLTFKVEPYSEQPHGRHPTRAPAESWNRTRAEMRQELETWVAEAPGIETDWDALRHVYDRSLVDLAALRFFPQIVPGASLPAAGLPWFMALFGRDSLITSYQALAIRPDLARTSLIALAARQADEVDDFRDAEPGKILHELRFGELTAFGDWPHSPYYGTADATPLFLVVLDEYERWTGDEDLVHVLEPAARAALRWIDDYGDLDGDGYVEYKRRNEQTGLENQCWKDSWNSMLFANGARAHAPIACCEIQGYVYDAKIRCARLARDLWDDPSLADRLEEEAAQLKRRFQRDFWIDTGAYYALALDRDKRKVDSLTSNIGHLLWSGIVEPEHAAALAGHLMDDRLFSGWGVRTMATGEGGHNPLEYHNGTVWPHDTSLIAQGLHRYGYRNEAGRLVVALIEAAAEFTADLPEVFAGYPRELTQFPVEYPTASRPQAWSSGATLLGLRTVLGMEPEGDELTAEPALPERIGRLELIGVPGRWGSADVPTRVRPRPARALPPEAVRPLRAAR